MLSSDQKGNIAELAIAARAIELGVDVYRPFGEGGRFDMIFALGDSLLRIQCKWAPRVGDTVLVRCYSSRRNRHGILRRPYLDGEIDAFAAYCPDTRCCYLLPSTMCVARKEVRLRLAPCRNNQSLRINWARDYEFAAKLGALGAVAQLGERQSGRLEATGSSPVGSTELGNAQTAGHDDAVGREDLRLGVPHRLRPRDGSRGAPTDRC
jgi:PD-(D/E)XK endonuclease